jgi:adenylate cyclase
MARLILQTAEGQQAIDLRPVNSLGRHPSNSIQLLDKIVSKEHCIIELRGDVFVLRDLGSLNGTFINNERVRGEQLLRHGDEIMLGSTRGRFDDGSAPLGAGLGAGLPPAAAPPPPVPQAPAVPQWGAAPPSQAAQRASPLAMSAQMQAPAYGQQPAGAQQPYARAPMPPSAPPPMPPSQGWGEGYPQVPGSVPAQGMPMQQQGVPSHDPRRYGYAQGPMSVPGPHPGAAHVPGPQGTAPLQVQARQVPPPPAYGQQAAAHHQQHAYYVGQGTRIDVQEQARQIGTQIAAIDKGFQPFDVVQANMAQLRADYERLRLSYELSREIAAERDTPKLLEKILTAVFKFIRADRGVIFLRDEAGELTPRASQRRDGSNAPISVSSTILDHVVKERAAVLTADAAMDFAASKGKSMILNRISSAIVAPLLHDAQVLGVLWLDSETLAQFQAKDLELVTAIASQAAMFIEINILGKKVESEIVMRERFSRLLSPNVAERVISGHLEVKQGGQLIDATVFNSDIRGFTAMSEGLDPESLLEMLNEYFELMVDTIFRYEGTLDKFMGDGIMAIWGAPVAHPDDAIRSVQSALGMGEILGEYNRRRMVKGQNPLAVGIGIHSGPVVAGYVGSSKALSYTVIGDVANTSARLCSHALAGQIVVSEGTRERLGSRFEVEELQPAKVKGKEKPLRIFNVIRERVAVQVPAALANEPTSFG